jgi:DNA-3-methyladenine glycosylase II
METPAAARVLRSPRRALELHPRPPFRLDLTVWALRRREQNRIDTWDGRRYRRALLVDGIPVGLAVTQTGSARAPRLELALSGARVTPAIEDSARSTLTRLLGLEIDLSGFYARSGRDPALRELAERYRGLKPPRFPTLFECLLNAVACQQLSLAAGLTVLTRLAAAAGKTVDGLPAFPAPNEVLRLPPAALRALGFSERKVETIRELAAAAAAGELELEAFEPLDDATVVAALVQRRGLGDWSADYALLRGLGRLHVFPRGDIGALNGLLRFLVAAGRSDDPQSWLERFAPDAGLVYFHLLLRGLEQQGLLDRSAPS